MHGMLAIFGLLTTVSALAEWVFWIMSAKQIYSFCKFVVFYYCQ